MHVTYDRSIIMRTSTAKARTEVSGEQLRRLSGAALIAALPLQIVGFAVHPAGEQLAHTQQGTYGPAHLILFLSWILAMLGLPALYRAIAGRAGKVGLVAFVLTMLAVAYHLYLTLYEATVIPIAAGLPNAAELVGEGKPLAHGAGALGPLAGAALLAFPLLGVVVLRSRVLPRSVGWLQVAAVPAFVALMFGIGAVNVGAVGPDATDWVGGMLPIATLYWVLFTGYAAGGRALLRREQPDTRRIPAEVDPALQPAG